MVGENIKQMKKTSTEDDVEENVAEMVVETMPPEENTILFVKNLNFETTDEEIKAHFEQVIGKQSIHSATISR